jgi:hypothetical protein
MTMDAAIVEAAWALNRRNVERARQLAAALAMIREGMTPKESRAVLRIRYGLSQVQAWRIVDVANDMAGSK